VARVQFVAGELQFEWDTAKAVSRKHGVSFDEAATVFLDARTRSRRSRQRRVRVTVPAGGVLCS
jgi:uncharacterized DUF497 family protein